MHIFGDLVHILGELVHIFGKLVHISAWKLVSRTSKQVSRTLGPLWQPGVYNDTNSCNLGDNSGKANGIAQRSYSDRYWRYSKESIRVHMRFASHVFAPDASLRHHRFVWHTAPICMKYASQLYDILFGDVLGAGVTRSLPNYFHTNVRSRQKDSAQ